MKNLTIVISLSIFLSILNVKKIETPQSGKTRAVAEYSVNDNSFFFDKTITKNKNIRATKKKGFSDPEENMILIEGGTFEMGNDMGYEDERPVHKITVDNFYICKYEVTVKEYFEFLAEDKAHYPEWMKPGNSFNIEDGTDSYYKVLGEALNADDSPIVGVSWHDVIKYCEWLSLKTGKKYRLLTEAEWEFAAKGGLKSKGYTYSGSNEVDDVGWHRKNAAEKIHKVGTKKANELGIYDMSGNVWEWCIDRYGSDYYAICPEKNPQGPEKGQERIIRGGSWFHYPNYLKITFRYNVSAGVKNRNIGFRVAMSVE